MLGILAAATVMTTPVAGPPSIALAQADRPTITMRRSALAAVRAPAVSPCKAAGRFEVNHEPALLYRQQDRNVAKRLIDLPDAEKCLLGGIDQPQEAAAK